MRARDTMVKFIYKNLFQFLIDKMDNKVTSSKYIGILDIAGFGMFQNEILFSLYLNKCKFSFTISRM